MACWPEHRETVKMERNYTTFKSNCNLKARKKEILKSNKKKVLSRNHILVSMDRKEKQRENCLCPRHDFYFMAKFKYIDINIVIKK